jgi:hypothetical protein
VFDMCLFDIIFPGDDLKNVEAYRSITELYEKVYFNTSVFVDYNVHKLQCSFTYYILQCS